MPFKFYEIEFTNLFFDSLNNKLYNLKAEIYI